MKWKLIFCSAVFLHLLISVLGTPSKSVPVRVDSDLANAISRIQPNFGAYLKRAFTNAHITRNDVTEGMPHVILDKTFFQDNTSEVMIKNLRTIKNEFPRLTSIKADMLQDILVLSVDFGTLTLDCEYEIINRDVMNLLPVSSIGLLNATIESTRAQGRVGYKTVGDSLQAINFDIEYKIGEIHLDATYSRSGQKMHSQSTRSSIDETIFKGIRRDMERYFEGQLKHQLNDILEDVSLSQLFHENYDLIRKNVVREQTRTGMANELVDLFLDQIRRMIHQQGFSEIELEDFKKSFFWVIIWGAFEAKEGSARNLSTIYRTGDFSIHQEETSVTIFGSVGLQELACNYNHYRATLWSIGPSGKIAVSTGKNSVKFKIVSNGWITSLDDICQIIDYDLQVERIEKIHVDITGLGVLNSLASTIISWIVSLLNGPIVNFVESTIKAEIKEYLKLCDSQKHLLI